MKDKNKRSGSARNNIKRLIAVILAIVMALGLIASVLPLVFAASSADIQKELDALQEEADGIAKEKEELQAELDANEAEKDDIVAQKSVLDRQMNLTMEEIRNVEAVIEQYNLLIDVKRNELKAALHNENDMIDRYKLRVREMEEGGSTTYLDILFNAASFSDMLDRLDWIEEIRSADQKMLDALMEASQKVRDAEDELYDAQKLVEDEKALLMEKEQELLTESLAAQKIIDELCGESEEMKKLLLENELLEEETMNRLAVLQQAYEEAVTAENEAARIRAAEEAARKILEEQERQKRELKEEALREQEQNDPQEEPYEDDPEENEGYESDDDPDNSWEDNWDEPDGPHYQESSGGSSYSSVDFIWPASGAITSPFGSRIHPVYGYEINHDGIDIDAWRGDPILAAASGTVITSSYGSAAGYYCTIAHDDGFATIYMHMQSAPCVSVGQYVSQGQVIGYVGDTGVATGAHLHFGMLINGSYVNPVAYLP